MKLHISHYHLKNAFQNKRIILLSDIHYYKNINQSIFSKLLLKTMELKPDYICITGDLFDRADAKKCTDMKPFYSFLEKLAQLAPVMIILGNHDIRVPKFFHKIEYYKDLDVLKKIRMIPNVHLLENETKQLDSLFFMGYEAPFSYYKTREKRRSLLIEDAKKKLKSKKDCYSILLFHTPIGLIDLYESLDLKRYGLILCGHTHNGMVPARFKKGNRGIISPSKGWFPKNVRGHVTKDTTDIIISGGITKLSYSSGIFRYCNRFCSMEITVIDL